MAQQLTIKERKLIEAYSKNGGNGTAAALEVYDAKTPEAAAVIASRTLNKPSVAEALKAEMDNQGITMEQIIAPITRGLQATNKDNTPNYSAQLAAHDRAVKILGLTEPKEDKHSPSVSFNINKANFGGEFVTNDED